MRHLDDTFIICNPEAGGGSARKKWQAFQELLRSSRIQVKSQFTEDSGQATEITMGLIDKGYQRIAVFGGDGTFNEVLQGVIENDKIKSSQLTLIFLGAGSSNDFEKIFEQRQSLLPRLLSEKSFVIDVGKVQCQDFKGNTTLRYFAANSSMGVISLAIQKFNTASKVINFLKKVSVDVSALSVGFKALLEFEEMKCNLKLDGKALSGLKLKNLTVFKSPYFGGGMNYGISTKADDGKFHVAFIESINRLKLCGLIPSLYTGKILSKRPAHYEHCQSLEVKCYQPVFVETDGEIIGYPPANYTLLKRALRVIV